MINIERAHRTSKVFDLTPLIDVVFLLMVFFILTTGYVDVEALKLAVSEDNTDGAVSTVEAPMHDLILLDSGAAFLNKKLVYHSDLDEAIDLAFHQTQQRRIRVRCEDSVKVQLLIDVLDIIKRRGGEDVNVARWKRTHQKL
ncbi:MAG: biopolymer transporter ExbD [Alphaproteobacteria bacterium]|nr:MAG: biopolymer transporter ExbD [Alphaproteobacteria bacterium]TAF14257.1 MAG: biopolymer transporter ExbD [Alphaproteobacteria bacterium]TAF41914.1 MAG: biopolymer transporter ExbD [Alphaproteobacteria bacterium]TAF76783.1 MAG: biopolymer transporter ExbD [Alphaproteobacteria bacterium]